MSRTESFPEGAGDVVEKFTGYRPAPTILHLIDLGSKKAFPTLETPDGIEHYLGRYLLGEYNTETRNAVFIGKGAASQAMELLKQWGFEVHDVTRLLLQKSEIPEQLLSVVDPSGLASLCITSEDIETLRQQNTENHG